MLNKILSVLVLTLFLGQVCNAIVVPGEKELTELFASNDLGYFAEKTKIVNSLAGKDFSAEDIAAIIDFARNRFSAGLLSFIPTADWDELLFVTRDNLSIAQETLTGEVRL